MCHGGVEGCGVRKYGGMEDIEVWRDKVWRM